jgi:predicted phage terminase large subunit-like protein
LTSSLEARLLTCQAELAKRSFYKFVKAAWDQTESVPFLDNWHVGAVCEHLQAVFTGQIKQLLINIPPGCSKSLLTCVFFPAWGWANDPTKRWFYASYDQRLSTRDSVKCRTLLEKRWYQQRFPGQVAFKKDQDQKTYYETTAGGFRLATSVGGHGTGEHPDFVCVPPGTLISTPTGPRKIEEIRIGDTVYGYDHPYNSSGCYPVTQLFRRRSDSLIEIEHELGTLRLTENHPVYVEGKGYTAAAEVMPGDVIYYAGDVQVRGMQGRVSADSRQGQERSESILLQGVPGQGADGGESSELGRREAVLPYLRQGDRFGVGPATGACQVLLACMSEMAHESARRATHGPKYAEPLQDSWRGAQAGWGLRHLCGDGRSGRASHQRELAGQSIGESMHGVQAVPLQDSSRPSCHVAKATVLSCRRMGYDGPVFNIEVGTVNNYFAGGVLVHNCVDDPHNVKEAESETERQTCRDWWDLTMSTRGVSRGVRRVIIMQRLHEADLAGHVLSQGGWEHLCLPMRYEPTARATSLGFIDPRRTDGELLTARQFNDETVRELEKKLGAYGTAGQLQQRPAPKDAGFFKTEKIGIVDAAPTGLSYVRRWDTASTANGGDYTAGVLMGRTGTGDYYVLDVVRGQYAPETRGLVQRQTADLDGAAPARRHVPQVQAEEPGSAGKDQSLAFVKLMAGHGARTERETGDKEVRAYAFASQVNAGNVRIVKADWNRAFLDELKMFPAGKYDDQVDAAAGAFNWLERRPDMTIVTDRRTTTTRRAGMGR